MRKVLVITGALLAAPLLQAGTPTELLRDYAERARVESAGYSAPSAAAGRKLFSTRQRDWSCSTCHMADPTSQGRHVVTGKPIAPLAPGANPQRFRDTARAEKWFKRNCNDTLGRACTASEKADLLAYLLTLEKGN